MAFPWGTIDHRVFEDVALDFISDQFPDQSWAATPKTRDGNRDATATVYSTFLNDPVDIQAWLEAKYTVKERGLIAKSHLDPTLVSALIDTSVGVVIFVTNGRFDSHYIERAQKVGMIARHLRSPKFYDGQHLEDWLHENPETYRKYFGETLSTERTRPPSQSIEQSAIWRRQDFIDGHSQPVKNLISNDRYTVSILVRSMLRERVSLDISSPSDHFIIAKGQQIDKVFNAGFNVANFEVTAGRNSDQAELLVSLRSGSEESTIALKTSIVPRRIEIVSDRQMTALQLLHRALTRHNEYSTPSCVQIVGRKGTGKSWLLDRFSEDLPFENDFSRRRFVENQGDNARLICQVLLFLTFGALSNQDLSHASFAKFADTSDIDELFLADLISGVSDSTSAHRVLLSIVNGDYHGSLVTPHFRGTPKVLVLDDLHKLSNTAADALARLLADLAKSENPTLVIAARRTETPETIVKSLGELTVEVIESKPASQGDIANALRRNLRQRQAEIASEIVLNESTHGFLSLVPIVSEIAAKGEHIGALEAPQFQAEVLGICRRKGVESFLATPRPNAQNLIAIACCAVDSGIERDFWDDRGFGSDVNVLLDQGLLVPDSNERSRVSPRHDIFREQVLANRAAYTTQLVEILEDFLTWSPKREADVLATLLDIEDLRSERFIQRAYGRMRALIANTEFGVAEPLARQLIELAGQSAKVREALSIKQYLQLLFDHAECLTHVRSTRQSQAGYEAVIETALSMEPDEETISMEYLATAEVVNSRFWQHDHSGLLEQIDTLLERIEGYCELENENAMIVLSRNNALNRKMMLLAVRGEQDQARQVFQDSFTLALDANDNATQAHLLMDWAKCSLRDNPERAVDQYSSALELYKSINEQNRRRSICKSQLMFARLVVGSGDQRQLEMAVNTLRKRRYFPEYGTGVLQRAAVALVRGDHLAATALLETIGRQSSLNYNARRKMLWHHLSSVAAFLSGEIEAGRMHTQKALNSARDLDPAYAACFRYNATVPRSSQVDWAFEATPAGFIIDPRIW